MEGMASISNNEIKRVKSLQQKKFRDESGLFIVEGQKMVDEAMKSSYKIEAVYYRDEIGEEAMKRITSLSSPSPVLAVVRKPDDAYLHDISVKTGEISKGGLYLGLDSIRDPGNLGTILRIADWFGINAVFATMDTVDVFNPKVVQATMGAVFRVKMHYVDLPELSKIALSLGGKVYGTFLDGKNIYAQELENKGVIVMGNEGNGISANIEKWIDKKLFIPNYPIGTETTESLNVAIATSIDALAVGISLAMAGDVNIFLAAFVTACVIFLALWPLFRKMKEDRRG